MEVDFRLTPGMASRRLQVVSFVLQYVRRWGKGPSYGEIAGALNIERTTARDHVRRAVARGELLRDPGDPRRSLRPPPAAIAIPPRLDPAMAAQLVEHLRAEGYLVDGATAPTFCPLPRTRELDHIPHHEADGPRQAA